MGNFLLIQLEMFQMMFQPNSGNTMNSFVCGFPPFPSGSLLEGSHTSDWNDLAK